jgi:zinc transport system substrate-binding protein
MQVRISVAAVFLVVVMSLSGAVAWRRMAQDETAGSSPTIIVTTSLLADAAADLAPALEDARIVSLMPPGACPGHFDLAPQALPQLSSARLVLLHGFQQGLIPRLKPHRREPVQIIRSSGSLLIPEQYVRFCEQIGQAMQNCWPEHAEAIGQELKQRIAAVRNNAQTIQTQADAWQGVPAIASMRQKQYAEWLGFRVVAQIRDPAALSPSDWAAYTQEHPALVIGNLQSDGDAARAIAERLGVPVAVLSNFPNAAGYGASYDDLQQANLERIAAAWKAHAKH